jgi:hypothetical protein
MMREWIKTMGRHSSNPRSSTIAASAQVSTSRTRSLGSAHFFVLFAAAASIVFIFSWTSVVLLDVSIALLPVSGIVCLAAGVSCVKRAGIRREDRFSIVWFCFLLTVILWVASLFAFAVYPVAYGVTAPTPSFIDVLMLLGYAPLLFGLLMQLWPFGIAFANRSLKGLSLLVIACAAGILYAILPALIGAGGDGVALAVNLAYPVLDLVCLSIAIPTLALFMEGTYWRPVLWIVIGLVFLVVGDVATGLATTYSASSSLNLLYIYGMLAGTLGWRLRQKQFVTGSL